MLNLIFMMLYLWLCVKGKYKFNIWIFIFWIFLPSIILSLVNLLGVYAILHF